jgi:hypothetical protein
MPCRQQHHQRYLKRPTKLPPPNRVKLHGAAGVARYAENLMEATLVPDQKAQASQKRVTRPHEPWPAPTAECGGQDQILIDEQRIKSAFIIMARNPATVDETDVLNRRLRALQSFRATTMTASASGWPAVAARDAKNPIAEAIKTRIATRIAFPGVGTDDAGLGTRRLPQA